ncbi:MAG: hypothetical protein ACXU82_17175 [Caulobacteraceae bacterium]
MRRLLAGALFALAVPCSSQAVPAIMMIHGVQADRDGITVRAPALGPGSCTPTRRNLTIAVSRETGEITVLVAQRGPVECGTKGGPANVHWSYKELGLEPGQSFHMANPMAPEPGS